LFAPRAQAPALADWLIGLGAEDVIVRQSDYVFTARNPLYERLVASLTPGG
jgi:ATP phosphoribosyltransferase